MFYNYILFGFIFFLLSLAVGDISAFHDKKNVELNNEINQIAIEVSNYINQSESILQSNNANVSKAVATLNLAQLN